MKLPTHNIEFLVSGKDLTAARKYAGLTQRQLAKMIGFSAGKMVKVEKTKNPSDILTGAEMKRIMNIIYNQRGSDHE